MVEQNESKRISKVRERERGTAAASLVEMVALKHRRDQKRRGRK